MPGLYLWKKKKKKGFEVGLERVEIGFLSERKGKVISFRGAEDGKDTGTNCGKSSTENAEDENIRM